jgi:hypothetical protein
MIDDSIAINKSIDLLYRTKGGGTVELEPHTYLLQTPILRRDNITIKGAYCGAHLFDNFVASGTILHWVGPEGGTVVYDAPLPDDWKIDNGGVCDLAIDGRGKAAIGLQCMSAYYASYAKIHCIGVRAHAFYFGTLPTLTPSPNYHVRMDDLTACVTGGANGIVLDGTPGGGRNTCFLSARNCHVTFANGVAYALSNCDDCGFTDCAASMISGGEGAAIYFHGSSDGSGKAAYANRVIGFKSNAPIVSASGSSPARGNYVLTNAVDGVPLIFQSGGSTLTVEVYDGEAGFSGLVRNPLRNG